MKLYKLHTHTKGYCDHDLILNPKVHSDMKAGDVVEVYDPTGTSRLLLQISEFKDLNSREAISIETGIAKQFNFRLFSDVVMRLVNVADGALDSIELTFNGQYLGRSEMWRLKLFLTNRCVYVTKKINCSDMLIRCQVYEMWASGEKRSSGIITEDTKIVFRSSTSMVYLFLQMSSEMWDVDIHGDLYFEKAVNGFLTELFQKWKKMGCNHEVTIVLFSRTFYAAKSLDEFPDYMHDCLQLDYKGRYYEDFYRVAIQNERNDDWCTVLSQLRKLFTSYKDTVLRYHQRDGFTIPAATNSTAAQGNFLEVLNISLNTFEKHYLDRTFDRTGQLSVVMTPGVGVFEVDRELTNITKQRIIDNGVGSDLVCVGEQPLHAVPLLKFHNKDTSLTSADDYSLPHWINLSFYSTNKTIAYSNFLPRIKLPTIVANSADKEKESEKNFLSCNQPEYSIHSSLFDPEAYDEQIFQPPPAQGTCSLQRIVRAKKTSVPSLETYAYQNNDWESPTQIPSLRRKMSDPDIHHGTSGMLAALTDTPNLSESLASEKNARRAIVSIAPIVRPGRALINPFDPSHVTIKLTSNRRRWTHIFPKGPTGVLIQQHHYQAVPTNNVNAFHSSPSSNIINATGSECSSSISSFDCDQMSTSSVASKLSSQSEEKNDATIRKRNNSLFNACSGLASGTGSAAPAPEKTFLWGATGEQEWTPAITTAKNDLPVQRNQNNSNKNININTNITNSNTSNISNNIGCSNHIKQLISGKANAYKQQLQPIVESRPRSGNAFNDDNITSRGKIIIGVDWKSLTIPACLPITTDYFPDKRSLHNDYVISDYTLLPEDVNLDYAQKRAVYRNPLTTEEVFKEIVSQRLAQGFQLIVLEEKNGSQMGATSSTPAAPTTTVTSTISTPAGATAMTPTSSVVGKHQRTPSALSMKPPSEVTKDYLLSIGRIFHKISLTGSVITVTRYRPRHPYPPINVDYRYRFHAPQHETYEISGVNFTTEKLENFNWNYMDHYICTRGDTDYPLIENLKYWRYRMYLLPKENAVTKKIMENECQRCDIYTDMVVDNVKQHVEDFLRFMEVHINKLKRQINKPRDTAQSHLTRRRHSTSIISRPQANQHVASKISEKHHSSQQSIALRTTPKADRGRISPAAEAASTSNAAEAANRDDQDDGFIADSKLRPNATLMEIFDAMKHPVTGVGFFAPTPSLPSYTFVSYDALIWLKSKQLENPMNPLEILEAMRKEKLICHASGSWEKSIIPGFCLYYIAHIDKTMRDNDKPLNDLSAFENEWMEIELQGCSFLWTDEGVPENIPNFLKQQPTPQSWTDYCQNKLIYGHSHLEIFTNPNQCQPNPVVPPKSERKEWGHVKYHTVMQPGYAFELVVEWVTSSGPIVWEWINGWIRKATLCGYQLIPVPADPMAEPFTEKSDPLRGPMFIPLNIRFLPEGKALFEDFAEDSRADRMLLFQEAILARYGFLPCVVQKKSFMAIEVQNKEYQYVHCSGNMFVLIRCSQNSYPMDSPSRQEANVTRCVYGHTNNTNVPRKVGFLWAWNHMIPNKKWKALTIQKLDGELFQLRMLKDFREFCSNADNRLLQFWQHCQDQQSSSNVEPAK